MRKIQKEVVSNATNTDFFNLFFKSESVTKLIGYFGQGISGVTEFHFIFSSLGGSYNFLWSNLLPMIGGLFGVYIFEVVGVRVFLVRIVRQIALKQFGNKEELLLFTFNLLFVLALCGANLLTSWLGQTFSFTSLTNVTTTDKTHQLEIEKNAKIESLNYHFDTLQTNKNRTYEIEKVSIIKSSDYDIKELKNSRFTHRDDKKKYDNYTTIIDGKLVSKTDDLKDLNKLFTNDKAQLEKDRKNGKKRIETAFDNRINDISKTEKGKVNLWETVQKYTLPILILFILLSWIAIIYTEVFYKGSGQNIEVKEVSNRPLLLWVFAVGMYDKFYHWLYGKVVNKIGLDKYRYTEIRNNELEIEPQQLLNPSNIAAKTGTPQTNFRQIGFNPNRTNPNETNNNNVTNQTQFHINQTTPFAASPVNNQTFNGERITVNVTELKDNQKRCKHCDDIFTYKHWNAKYCSDDCRIKSWEERTGKTFNKKSKNK
jgi:hypothetical protein